MKSDESFLTRDLRDMIKHTVLMRHRLEEPYRDLEHQTNTARFGMWLFLATEIMLFGSLFMSLGVYHYFYPVAFEKASGKLNWEVASLNTVVLLTSSYTIALAVHAAQQGNTRHIIRFLSLTIALGILFVALKFYEYYTDYQEWLIPGWKFHPQEWMEKEGLTHQVGQVQLFLTFYWTMTVLHLAHMAIGLSLLTALIILAKRQWFSAASHAPIEAAGLYWHFVDVVWVFLLPTLYLISTLSW